MCKSFTCIGAVFVFFCFLQTQAATTIYGPKKFSGSQPTARIYNEILNVSASDLNRNFTIKIVNADGQTHQQRTCNQSNILSRLACAVVNAANKLYISLARVQKFDLKNNGTILISSNQVNQTTATFTATLNLSAVNNLNLSLLGSTVSSLTIEIQKDDAPADVIPPLAKYSLDGISVTNSSNSLITITDASPTTTTVWVDRQAVVVNSASKSIPLVLTDGMHEIIIQSRDSFGNISSTMNPYFVTVDTKKPNISSDIVANYYASQLPYFKNVKIVSNENLAFIQVNNQSLLQVGVNEYMYLMEITDASGKDLNLVAIDFAGNETNQVIHTNVIVDADPPVIATNFIPKIIIADHFDVNVTVTDVSSTITQVFVDNVEVVNTTNALFVYQIPFPVDQSKTLKIVSTDQVGNFCTKVYNIARNTQPLSVSIISPQNQSVVPQVIEFRALANKPLSSAKINGQLAVVSDDQISVKANLPQFVEGNINISVEVFDIYGNTTQQNVVVEVRFFQSPSWAYEECPVDQE